MEPDGTDSADAAFRTTRVAVVSHIYERLTDARGKVVGMRARPDLEAWDEIDLSANREGP